MIHTKEQIMAQVQVFASAWSLVGGPFDTGFGIEGAEDEKESLAAMVENVTKQRDELLASAKTLISRKRPGAIADDPRLILEIDCIYLEEIVEKIEKQGGTK